MLGAWATGAAIAVYLALLTWIGWRADRQPALAGTSLRGLRYGLSLATLCSAWTYFGAVGDASRGSWLYVANAIGPVLALTVFRPAWRRIAILAKQENVGSLADFLAARYGKNRALGILVTVVATLGALPYIALQLGVLTQVWDYAADRRGGDAMAAIPLVLVLVGMAIMFGTRSPSLTRQSRGFVGMVSVESLVKIAGLMVVAGFCIAHVVMTPDLLTASWQAVPAFDPRDIASFAILTLLCTATAFTLPRQFHLGFVMLERVEDVDGARWVVPAYFTLWVACTLVIATGIRGGMGVAGVSPYLQMLAVPLASGHSWIALLAWLGGVSAGGAMVVVELTAISAMISNEIILPLMQMWLRKLRAGRPIGPVIVAVRRITIFVVAVMAWAYYLGVRGIEGPTELGLTALTAFAQLVPPLVGGIYWRRGHASGALAGVATGIAIWAMAIAAPAFLIPLAHDHGLLWPILRDTSAQWAILVSLLVNALCYVFISLSAQPRLIDTIQANSFVPDHAPPPAGAQLGMDATWGDLRRLLGQFLGPDEADQALTDMAIANRLGRMGESQTVSRTIVRAAERVLAGVIGAPSARNVVAIALAGGTRDAAEIGRLLDEAGHAVHFSRELLQTTLESLPQGVCVVDEDARVVAWNARFFALLGQDDTPIHIGKSLHALLPEGDRQQLIAGDWRNAQSAMQTLHQELVPGEGVTLSLSGRPLAGGDYLLTLTDITERKQAQKVLEQRVLERTAALNDARQRAELAFGAQRRFVAAASHDLVQPLHAARLFIGHALMAGDHAQHQDLLAKADQAVEGAHRLLAGLLKLSQLEVGALQPQREAVDVGALFVSLLTEFEPMARARNLQLVALPTRYWIMTDRDLLRSVLQNLILNALRYTPAGRVVVLARRRGDDLCLEVRDTGVGIAEEQLPGVFGEFSRLAEGEGLAEGAGLGLSIVMRIAQALGHGVAVRSRKGQGSVFSLTAPITRAQPPRIAAVQVPVDLGGLRVLCVEDDPDALAGTAGLLSRWGASVTPVSGCGGIAAQTNWDVALVDYRLGDGDGDGLSLLRALQQRCGLRILITATPEPGWAESLPREGIELLLKPIAPLALKAMLLRCKEMPDAHCVPDAPDRSH